MRDRRGPSGVNRASTGADRAAGVRAQQRRTDPAYRRRGKARQRAGSATSSASTASSAGRTHYGLGVAESAFGMGNPWDRAPLHRELAGLLPGRVQTPLLIVHGSNDDAVAVHLAEEVFVDLRRGQEVARALRGGGPLARESPTSSTT